VRFLNENAQAEKLPASGIFGILGALADNFEHE